MTDLEIGSPEELEIHNKYEALRLESSESYNLPEIAKKLASGKELNEIERQMASACIQDWVRLKESNTGRPRSASPSKAALKMRKSREKNANKPARRD